MSGAAMGLTSAARGFIVFLLSVQVIQGQDDWGVTYTSPQICALKGTTVEIRCSYRYPSRLNEGDTTAERTFWTTDRRLVDLRLDSNYTGRVQHHCDKRDCALRIRDVRESDSAEFNFRFITQSNSYTGSPGVRLTVTGFQVQMSRIQSCNIGACTYAELNCHSRCPLTDRPSYIWYKNGQKMDKVEKPFYHYFYAADSYSCAVTGHKDVPSRSVCVHGQSCNRVTYDDRNICAFKGSTVNISCNYNSYESIKTKFWFRFDQSGYNTRPKDLSKDPQYAGRVKVFENEEQRRSTLSISDLRERDSAEYHCKFTTGNYEWESSLPGTTLTVTDPDLQVQVIWSSAGPKLICHSSCLLVGRSFFVWYKNDTIIFGETSFSYGGKVDPADSYSCAHQRHRSPSVYAPKRPSVSVSPSAEIEEGSSVNLSCSSDANPAANYSWYRKNQTLLSEGPQFVFSSIQSSDYGQYYCVAENELGRRTSTYVFVNVKYAPKRPSVSVSPSAEIVEGSSVTLSCSSDANPAANYTWYKENQTLVHGPEGIYRLTSISSEDRGNYFCKSENQYGQINSSSQYLDVKYAPKRPSVSVSPSEIEEGSSVTLTCSSDANPAANYTWYKEDEDSPKASGQIFTITEFRAEDSGNYYCEAENNRGRRNSTLRLITVAVVLGFLAVILSL